MSILGIRVLSCREVFQKITSFGAPNSLGATCRNLRMREDQQYALRRTWIHRYRDHLAPKLAKRGKVHLLNDLFSPVTGNHGAALKTRRFFREIFGRERPGDEIPTIHTIGQRIEDLSKPDAADIKVVWRSIATAFEIDPPLDLDTLEDGTAEALFTEWAETLPRLSPGSTIILSGPGLKNIPEALTLVPGLWELTIENCPNLETLPKTLDRLQGLNHFTVKHCPNLHAIPDGLFNITRLFRLDIDDCDSITSIPENIANLQRLHYFHLTNCNGIEALPESFAHMNQNRRMVVRLNGCHNLGALPNMIGNMRLYHLDISDLLTLTALPDSIGRLDAGILKCSGCSSLLEIPDTFAGNTAIHSLDFSGCTSLTHIPESFIELTRLDSLNISSCRSIREIPARMWQRVHPARLDFSDCPLIEDVPELIGGEYHMSLSRKEFDPEIAAKQYTKFRILKTKDWVRFTLPKNYYKDFVEKTCVDDGSIAGFTKLIWINPKSAEFDTEAAQILPPALQNRIFRVVLSILVNILTLGLLKHFSNPLIPIKTRIKKTFNYKRYVAPPGNYMNPWLHYQLWGHIS